MMTTKDELITEVARIIGLPIIPMQPTAVHDSKPFPHLVQHASGRLFLDGQQFDPLTNAHHFLLVEAWLERQRIAYRYSYDPLFYSHTFQIEQSPSFVFAKRPLAGCMALVHQFSGSGLEEKYFHQMMVEGVAG